MNTPLSIAGGFVVLVSALVGPASAQELRPAPVAALSAAGGSETFRLTEDVLRSLVWVRSAGEALVHDETAGGLVEISLNSATTRHRAILDLRTASSFLVPYTMSPRKEVRNAASAVRLVYDLLLDAFEGSIEIDERLADEPTGGTIAPLFTDAGSCAIAADRAWRLLPIAMAVLSDALVDPARTSSDGHVSYLTLTSEEAADLIKQIEVFFGPDAAAGRIAGLHPTAGSAGRLVSFLREPWRGSEKP